MINKTHYDLLISTEQLGRLILLQLAKSDQGDAVATNVLVTGAGGFLGGHMVGRLLDLGDSVVAADIKPLSHWWQCLDTRNVTADLRDPSTCERLVRQVDVIYHFAADMGGIAYINENDWKCASSVAMTVNMLGAAIRGNVRKFVYTSSACVYPLDLQQGTPIPLHETLALPLNPERGYGWEKFFSEQLCDYASSSSVLRTEVARLFNVYGPHGSWCDGREKAPAAVCRKVAEAAHIGSRQIEVWGSGAQIRSFLYIDDCITGLISLADAGYAGPVNLASTELATITEFVQVVASVAGVDIEPRFDETRPIGAHARVPDTTRAQRELKWRPTVSLRDGIEVLYPWIYEQVSKRHAYQSAAGSFQAPANA